MLKSLTLLGFFIVLAQITSAQCPVESNTCQGSSPCVEIDLFSLTFTDINDSCHVTITVDIVQGSGGGTIKKLRIGAVGLAGDGVKLCSEFTDISSGTTSISDTFYFPGICVMHDPIDFVVEGYTCLNNDNCCCGRQEASSTDALPVELTSFIGRAQKNENVLTWTTESEENAFLFSVEKSTDGRSDFKPIGEVLAAGFSDSPRNYFFMDDNPFRRNFYRLQTVDLDGSFQYSDVISVQRKDISFSFLDVFPIPADRHVTAIIHSENESNAEILLYNLQGQKILHQRDKLVEGVNRLELNWEEGSDPIYFLTVYNGKEWIVKKIVLVTD